MFLRSFSRYARFFSSKTGPTLPRFFIPNADKAKMKRVGYSEDQLENMGAASFDFYKKNSLTETEELLLSKMGYSEDKKDSINAYLLQLSSLNSEDDGYGMRPMTRKEMLESIVLRDIKPDAVDLQTEESGEAVKGLTKNKK